MIRSAKLALTPVLVLALVAPTEAGLFRHGRKARRCVPPPRCAAPAAGVAASAVGPAPTPQAAAQAPGDFLGWLNTTRARHGLAPVGWDAGLAADAAANSSRGFGHFHMGRARRQNAGVGDLAAVSAAWMASPSHASAILDPSIRAVGLANVGGTWTFSAN